MKTNLLIIAMFILHIAQGQVPLIPNGGFDNGTTGWEIDGIDTSIIAPDGVLEIIVQPPYSRDFTLTSPQFHLEANKAYKLYYGYLHLVYDDMGEHPGAGFTDIFIKDVNDNIVFEVQGYSCDGTGNQLDQCNSIIFTVNTNGNYFIEFIGHHQNGDDFYVDNIGFENVQINTFSGTVTLDENNDDCATSSTTIANFPIKVTETSSNFSYFNSTDANGNFTILADNISGNYITEIDQAHYNSIPLSYTTTINPGVNNIVNQNFCISPTTETNNLNIYIIPIGSARPGFNAKYEVRYTNMGASTLDGSVELEFDDTMITYLNASIAPDQVLPTNLSWNYVNLLPFEVRSIYVDFNVLPPPTVNNGDELNYIASITPITGNNTPADNTFTLNQVLVGSYDPNDISFLEGPFISPEQASDYLNILVRFQNTGTASAINVRIENTLDPLLDWSTFQPIAASHNYHTIIRNDSEVEFVFNNIHLADSLSNEPESHGWISYKIKPRPSFTEGEVISNVASIYFDYNLPIITNIATTQIDNSLAILDTYNISDFKIYPNPTYGMLAINIDYAATYSMFNINGQTLKKGHLHKGENTLNLSNHSSGIYFIRIITEEGKASTKKIIIN